MPVIEAVGLSKVFRHAVKEPGLRGAVKHLFTQKYIDKIAVDNVDLKIHKGEAVAYIGPNGAGKSTTIKMFTGILVPSSGRVTVDGVLPYKRREQNAKKIGAVFGQRTQLWWDIPIIEFFSLFKDIYEIPQSRYKENLKRFSTVLDLDEFIGQPARKLSLGQRMRADLAASLLHDPMIVYLDEPTIGLDIDVKERVREFIKEINNNGTTVMLTTHDIGDIEDICRRIVIIDYGKIIYDGTLDEVKNRFARERTLKIETSSRINDSIKDELTNNIDDNNVTITYPSENEIHMSFDTDGVSARDLISRAIELLDVNDFSVDEPKIETVIKQVYSRTIDLNEAGSNEAVDDDT